MRFPHVLRFASTRFLARLAQFRMARVGALHTKIQMAGVTRPSGNLARID
jgi:hypothetical protein